MMRNDPETQKPYGAETMEKMEEIISSYKQNFDQIKEKEQESQSPFKKFTQKYSNIYTKEKIINLYVEEMKKDLHRNFYESDSKSDKTMESDASENQFINLMQDAQDPEEDIPDLSIDDMFEKLKNSLKEQNK